MKAPDFRPPLGATGRADLLRALAAAPRESLTLDADGESWFGYVQRPEPPAGLAGGDFLHITDTVAAGVSETGYRPPLRMPFVHLIAERVPRQAPPADEETTQRSEPAEPLDEDGARAPSPRRLVGYQDLVPWARLLPALRRQLGATRTGSLDLNRLVRCLAAREMPRHLPRRRWQRWHPELVVVLDFCPRLWPYREDLHRLAERLLRHCGRSGVSLRIVDHGPSGPWSDWLGHQNPAAIAPPPKRRWTMPPAGTPVLLVGDLGLLLGAESGPARDWRGFIARLAEARLRPLALVPLGAGQLDGALPPALPVLRWSPDARARPERPRGSGNPVPAGLDDLLAMAAATRRIDPPLLRALRRINPRSPSNAGLEGAFWCHADVEAGFSAGLRGEAQETHLRRFSERLKEFHAAIESLRHTHHAHLRAALNHEESLLWRAHARVGDAELPPATRERISRAEDFIDRLAATLEQPGSPRNAAVWWSVARDMLHRARADAALGERYGGRLMPLVAALAERGIAPPDWADPARLAGLLGEGQAPVDCWLVRDAGKGCLLLQAKPAGERQSQLGEPLRLDAGGARWRAGEGKAGRLAIRDLPVELMALNEPGPLRIETASEEMTVAAVRRPRGISEWACLPKGIVIRAAALGDSEPVWEETSLRAVPEPEASIPATPGWSFEGNPVAVSMTDRAGRRELRWGIDRPFGVWAEFTLFTPRGTATQRLRWIEPGRFLMGSPEDEPERSRDEGPRHPVTLTRGYWLADTACTQALWRAVTGGNPSFFKEDDRCPVEQVSWRDVQDFLRKLEALLPGCRADLPTEAEWEYACRAGTESPFSFGAGITPEQVNYHGDYPYVGGGKGLYRQRTVPVKSLPPNGWGLYEMHGNVWEWCADGLRGYDGEPRRDPLGPVLEDERAHRALRGGSWFDIARWARSACRHAYDAGRAHHHYRGFRLCLRSIEPGPVPGRPGGTAEVATGGSPAVPAPPSEEAGSLDKLKRALGPGQRKKR